jgi:hypothetical protein
MGEMMAQSQGWMFDETSALQNLNVTLAFNRIISACLKQIPDPAPQPTQRSCALQ